MLTRLTVIGAAYITVVCLLPEALIGFYNVPFYLGGTSILIVVSVTMDTVTQIQSHLLAHQYEGLIKKSKLRGNRGRYAGGTQRPAKRAGDGRADEPDPVRPAGGGEGHPGQAPGRRPARWSSSPPATCCARPSPRAPSSASGSPAIMERGELVSDEIVIELIEQRLPEAEAAGGAIFDGFPRTSPRPRRWTPCWSTAARASTWSSG